jgi:hypothetical protein
MIVVGEIVKKMASFTAIPKQVVLFLSILAWKQGLCAHKKFL